VAHAARGRLILTKRTIKVLLTAVLFCASRVPAFAQADPLPGFVTIAEGFTSPNRSSGIDAAYRRFSLPTFAKTCRESERPFTLTTPNGAVTLRVGEWFSLRRLIIVGADRTGHVLSPLPITLEVATQPSLRHDFGRTSDANSDGQVSVSCSDDLRRHIGRRFHPSRHQAEVTEPGQRFSSPLEGEALGT
jgi:hypothetical protein